MKADAKAMVERCNYCKKHYDSIHTPAEELHGILAP